MHQTVIACACPKRSFVQPTRLAVHSVEDIGYSYQICSIWTRDLDSSITRSSPVFCDSDLDLYLEVVDLN